jgi:hypothetical protein
MPIGSAPQPSNHPADYAEVLKNFKQSSTYMGELDRLVRLELAEMAEGGDPQGMREEYYKGWKDSDFKQLLADLGTPIKQAKDSFGVEAVEENDENIEVIKSKLAHLNSSEIDEIMALIKRFEAGSNK